MSPHGTSLWRSAAPCGPSSTAWYSASTRPDARRFRPADHEGNAAATPTLQRAVRAVADIPVEDVLRWGWMNAGASAAVWDHEGWLTSCTRQVQVVRDAGALASLPIHLTYLGMAIVWTGDFAGAASLV